MTAMTATVKRKRKRQLPFMAPQPFTNGGTLKPQPEPEDSFRYGFRYVEEQDEQGEINWVQIPLTLYDILHPQVGDFIVHSLKHGDICDGLKTICRNQWIDRPGTVVLSEVRVDLNLPGIKPVGPDVALFFDVEMKDDWSTFHVADEGSLPALIFEVTSPSTRHQDFGAKKDYYEQAGVSVYVIVDKRTTRAGIEFRLYGFELVNGRYVTMSADSRDWLWLNPIQAWIEADGSEINCYDSNEQPILDYEEIKQALSDTETRVQAVEEQLQSAETRTQEAEDAKLAAETRAQEAESRAKAMEEELLRLRALVTQSSESR